MDRMPPSPELNRQDSHEAAIERIVATALETLGVTPPFPEPLADGSVAVPEAPERSSGLQSSGRRDARG